jgi:hypothetical protein
MIAPKSITAPHNFIPFRAWFTAACYLSEASEIESQSYPLPRGKNP